MDADIAECHAQLSKLQPAAPPPVEPTPEAIHVSTVTLRDSFQAQLDTLTSLGVDQSHKDQLDARFAAISTMLQELSLFQGQLQHSVKEAATTSSSRQPHPPPPTLPAQAVNYVGEKDHSAKPPAVPAAAAAAEADGNGMDFNELESAAFVGGSTSASGIEWSETECRSYAEALIQSNSAARKSRQTRSSSCTASPDKAAGSKKSKSAADCSNDELMARYSKFTSMEVVA